MNDPEPGTEIIGHDRSSPLLCARCGGSSAAIALFCEQCGHDLRSDDAGARRWFLDVSVDRDHFLDVAPDRPDFPAGRPTRVMVLDDAEADVTIGRAEHDVDGDSTRVRAGDVLDPAVSRRHLRFALGEAGALTVTDLGSANGTVLNGTRELVPGEPISLAHGDRLVLGAWTSIAVREAPGAPR